MHRFYVSPNLLQSETIILPEAICHQIRDILRLREGQQIILFDDSGAEFLCKLSSVNRQKCEAEVIARNEAKRDANRQIVLCPSLLKSTKFELVLQKATELGVSEIIPLLTQRSVVTREEVSPHKIERWNRILQEAAEQSNRTHLPKLSPVATLTRVLDSMPIDVNAIFLWEEAKEPSLKEALHKAASNSGPVYLFIGPEGGFASEEAALARERTTIASMGPRILRAETASIAAIVAAMYELGELGG